MPELVSIIIPVYNAEKYLRETLKSVFSQTYKNIEIICVNDGSTDKSFNIIKSFTNKEVKIIQQKNAGASVARNNGLSAAKGNFIQFLDADDIISQDKIKKQVEVLERNPNKIAVCNYIPFKDGQNIEQCEPVDQTQFIYSSDNPIEFLANLWGGNGSSNFIQPNSYLVPRNIIDKAGFWRNWKCPDDDGEFFARVILNSEGLIYTTDVYNYYRQITPKKEVSLSKRSDYNSIHNVLLSIILKEQYLLGQTNSLNARKAIAQQYFNFAFFNFPKHKLLCKIALKKYQSFNISVVKPRSGGILFELIKLIAGWKTSRYLRYKLRE